MIAWLLLAAQATAPAAAPPAVAVTEPAIAPDVRKAAEELVRVARVDEIMRATTAAQIEQMRSGAQLSAQLDLNPAIRLERAKNPQVWDAAIARIGAKQADAFSRLVAEMQPAVSEQGVRIYAANFTLSELRQLAAFYQSPLGQRLVNRLPAITMQTTAWMQEELPRRLGPMIAALQPEIQRELGPLLPKQLPPPPPSK